MLFADLASNVLAVAIVMLLVAAHLSRETVAGRALAGQGLADRPQVSEPTIRIAPPLGPTGSLQLLVDRRSATPGLSIDVLTEGVRIGSLAGPASAPERVADTVRALPVGQPVRLYVFSHEHYRDLADRMRAAGHSDWREISVPDALSHADDWSEGMRRLAAQAISAERFRDGVLNLLAAQAGPSARASGRGRQAGAPMTDPDGSSLAERLRRWSGFVMLSLGGLALAVMESRTRHRLRRRRA